MRDAGCSPGPTRPVCATRWRPPAPTASPRRTTGSGGDGRGRGGRRRRLSPSRPRGTGWGRATASAFAEQAQRYGLATAADLEEVAAAWLRWAGADDGWLGMLHGELLIRV